MIEIKNLTKIYENGEKVYALNDVNLELPTSGFVSIVGESGSGKTTFLNCLSGFENITNGRITNIKKEDISFIFQDYQLLEKLTVFDNLYLVNNDKSQILCALEKVGLSDICKKRVNELSGGQKQRIAIARALLQNTKYIFADEPTGNLDHKNSQIIVDILKQISKDKLVLVVTHDKELFSIYSDRIIEFSDGKIILDTIKGNNKSNFDTDSRAFQRNSLIKMSIKKVVMLRKSVEYRNISTKIFNVLFSFFVLISLFLGINIVTNTKEEIICNACNVDNLNTLSFYKKNINRDYYYGNSLITSDDLNNIDFRTGNFAVRYDFLDNNQNGYFKYVYVCEKINSKKGGLICLNDNEVVLSFAGAKEIAKELKLVDYMTTNSLKDLSILIGRKIEINGVEVNIVGIDDKQATYMNDNQFYEDSETNKSYFYCNEKTFNILTKSMFSSKDYSYRMYKDDYLNNYDLYVFSSDEANLIYGRLPNDEFEISLSQEDYEYFYNSSSYSFENKKIKIVVASRVDRIEFEFKVVGVSDKNCISSALYNDYYIYSLEFGNLLEERNVAIIGKGITKNNIKNFLDKNYKDNNYLSEECLNAYNNSIFIGSILSIIVIPLGVILFAFQIINAKQNIYNYRRVIGLLKSMSFSNKKIIKVFLFDSIIENGISFGLSICFSPIMIKMINDFLINKHYMTISLTTYKPEYLLLLFVAASIISLISILTTLKKINKKSDVDLVYER